MIKKIILPILICTMSMPVFSQEITGYKKIKEERIRTRQFFRTHRNYTFKLEMKNTTNEKLTNVTAVVEKSITDNGSVSKIIDSEVSFPDIEPGATVLSVDTFNFNLDRRLPFSWDNLSWSIYSDSLESVADCDLNVSVEIEEYDGNGSVTREIHTEDDLSIGVQNTICGMSNDDGYRKLATKLALGINLLTQKDTVYWQDDFETPYRLSKWSFYQLCNYYSYGEQRHYDIEFFNEMIIDTPEKQRQYDRNMANNHPYGYPLDCSTIVPD